MNEYEFTIDNARMNIIEKMNMYGEEFPELKAEIFYFNKKLDCFTIKENEEFNLEEYLIEQYMKECDMDD